MQFQSELKEIHLRNVTSVFEDVNNWLVLRHVPSSVTICRLQQQNVRLLIKVLIGDGR